MDDLPNDGELLRCFARAGDEAPFQELLERHAKMVFQVCLRVLNNAADAEDAAQAVFLTLSQKAKDFSLQNSASLGGWLHTLAWRVAMRLRSAANARRKHEQEALALNPIHAKTSEAGQFDWEKVRPLLDEALAGLPEKYRLPFVLCDLEGRSQEEAAALADIPKRTLSDRLARARELLRAKLEQRGVALSAVLLSGLIATQASAGTLSASFVASTTKAASLAFAGKLAAGGVISGQSAALMQQALKMLFWSKLKAAAMVLFVFGAMSATGVTAYMAFAKTNSPKTKVESATAPGEKQSVAIPAALEPGPENGGLRLRLTVVPRADADKEGFDVRVDLLNVAAEPVSIRAAWWHDEENGSLKDYIEAAASIESDPPVASWSGQVMGPRRTLPQPELELKPGETLSANWQTAGRRLKNKVSDPLSVQNPEFPAPGLYSIHAQLVLNPKNRPAAMLRSNEQLVSIGGGSEKPKHSFGALTFVSDDAKTAGLGLGSLHKIEPGDQFHSPGGMSDIWTLTITEVSSESSTGTLEFSASASAKIKAGSRPLGFPQRLTQATLVAKKGAQKPDEK